MSISVLLVEDDRDLSLEIATFLEGAGFAVTCAGSIREAEDLLAEPRDLLILDINLPDGDGLSFCREARRYIRSGIVMCTGRGERELRIASLRDGADAYLVKPVDPEELEATLLSVHRRLSFGAVAMPSQLKPHPWYLNTERRLLAAPNGVNVLLSSPETLLLGTLFARSDRKVRKEELVVLLAADEDGYSSHRLEALVSRLRAKVATRSGLKFPLVSEYGKGYAFMEHGRLV
jgi:DNA-binding response OmpR family regulator